MSSQFLSPEKVPHTYLQDFQHTLNIIRKQKYSLWVQDI